MKVNTDSCILGACIPSNDPARILDIGTGTGLLALMMAQRFEKAEIDTVELDREACRQAEQNITGSPWPDRIHLHQDRIQSFITWTPGFYDMILTNPPWHENHQRSSDPAKSMARHNDYLPAEDLGGCSTKLTPGKGVLYMALPASFAERYDRIMVSHELYPCYRLHIFSKPNEVQGRIVLGYKNGEAELNTLRLTIYDEHSQYTPEFRSLLKDFYLLF